MSTTPNQGSLDSRYPRLTIRLPQWLLSNLKTAAAAEGTTTADLVRGAVIAHLSACHAIGTQATGQATDQPHAPVGVVITA